MPQFNWNTTFLINIPIALMALIGVHFFVEESKDTTSPKVDIPGVILSTISLFALVFGIIEAGAGAGFSTTVLLSFMIFAVTLFVFIRWEKHSTNAMLPLYLFRNPSFTIANITMTLMLFALIGFDFLIPQYFQAFRDTLHWKPPSDYFRRQS